MFTDFNTWVEKYPQLWSALSAFGQVGTLIVSIGAWIFLGLQIRNAAKSSDLQALQEFQKIVSEREADLINAKEIISKNRAFVEYLNFLEMYSSALNKSLLHGVAHEMVRTKIIESIAVIEVNKEWHSKIVEATTTSNTFKELTKFIATGQNRKLIQDARSALVLHYSAH